YGRRGRGGNVLRRRRSHRRPLRLASGPSATSLPGPRPGGAVPRQGPRRPPAPRGPWRAVVGGPRVHAPHARGPPPHPVARLREAALRRGAETLPLSRSLHPPRRSLHSTAQRLPPPTCDVSDL